jgi:hypothetical protein
VVEILGQEKESLWPERLKVTRRRVPLPRGEESLATPVVTTTRPKALPKSGRTLPALEAGKREDDDKDDDDNDTLPYRKAALIVGVGLGLMLCGSAPDALAGVRRVTAVFDTTASVNRPELIELIALVTEKMATYARESSERTELAVQCWSGRALGARAGARRWVVDSLAFHCQSPFKIVCDNERKKALTLLQSQRAPQVADFERAMKALVARLAGDPVASAGSCQASLLESADIIASGGCVVGGGDFVLEGCEQRLTLKPSHGQRIACCVIGRTADGDLADSLASSRVRDLRKLGYRSLNGSEEARLFEWKKFFDQASREVAAGR